MVQEILLPLMLMAPPVPGVSTVPRGGFDGHAAHDEVLIGMHFIDKSNGNAMELSADPVDVTPNFDDYLRYMPEDVARMSYADFWRWWYVFERYKGDEKGLREFDAIVDACLARGIKIKVDLAWSTWWTQDTDWTKEHRLAIGPLDGGCPDLCAGSRARSSSHRPDRDWLAYRHGA